MKALQKTFTGISGLDEILNGGLPQGRPTLIFGGPGCGKSALAMEFACRGAVQFGEPALLVSFEESAEDIITNFTSCSFGCAEAIKAQSVRIDSIKLTHEYAVEAGEFTLDGLLVRLEHSVKSIGARRLVLDSLDSLFSRFSDTANLRYEVSRIFQWIKKMGVTAIVTCEQGGNGDFTRNGLEAYVSDCVIHLDHRVEEQISKRRLRVIKYRGSSHGADEYPFLITSDGISLLPITSLVLETEAPTDFLSTGIDGLDRMLAGKGYYRGSTILVSGAAGTGKSTLAACFGARTCQNGSRCLYLSFEESTSQIVRNLRSIGIDIDPNIRKGLLRMEPIRPCNFGLEEHLVRVHAIVEDFKPDAVVMDPITSFSGIGNRQNIKSLLLRVIDFIKSKGITVVLSSLTPGSGTSEETETEVSSIVDTWIIIRFFRTRAGRRRQIYVHKARGIGHTQTMGELVLSDSGVAVKPFALTTKEERALSDAGVAVKPFAPSTEAARGAK
jgi:circadian clock protein KaiC